MEQLEDFNKMIDDCYDQDLDRIDQLDRIRTSDIRPRLKAGDRIGSDYGINDNRISFSMRTLVQRALETNRCDTLDKIFTYLQIPENLILKEKLAWYELFEMNRND